jgi:hypothetical protein
MNKYIISPVTTFDEEQELYATKVGMEGKLMPLYYIAFGNTEAHSRSRAEILVEILANYRSSQNSAVHPL